jgi:sugar O-acyltransferase (sialic acid O-acetyltransferase NeuD family)
MIIAGAGGHAIEVYNELIKLSKPFGDIFFFDEVNLEVNELFGRPVYHQIKAIFSPQNFVLGTGEPVLRKKLYEAFIQAGHKPINIISCSADISSLEVKLSNGLNVMYQAFVGPRVSLGAGTLVNARSLIHHDTIIGEFCEICPGVHISGSCTIGDEVFIGTGAVILPGVNIGNGSVVAAGAVVMDHVPENVMVAGVPAQIKKQWQKD